MTQTQIALVTGASRGFGYAVARALGAAGWHVVAVARTQGGLEELDDQITAAGGQATLAPMSITQPEAMQQLCRAIHDRWGRLNLWVHAALETPAMSPTEQVDPKSWERAVATNVAATGRLITYVSPLLRAAPAGQAVLVDDLAAGPFLGAYAACKGAQRALFAAWEAEQARLGDVKVARFVPAPMPTAHRARFFPGENRTGLASPADEAARLLASLG